METRRTKGALIRKRLTSLDETFARSHPQPTTPHLSSAEARKLRRRFVNRSSAHRVKKQLADEYSVLQRKADEAQQVLVHNVKRLAVLQANEVALTQATKQFSQLHDEACVENARLCNQEAVLTAALGLQEIELADGGSKGFGDTSGESATTSKAELVQEFAPGSAAASDTLDDQTLLNDLMEELPTMALPYPSADFTDLAGFSF